MTSVTDTDTCSVIDETDELADFWGQDVMIFYELNHAYCNWLQYSNCVTCTCYVI